MFVGSDHSLRVLLVTAASAISAGLGFELITVAYTTAHVAHRVLGTIV